MSRVRITRLLLLACLLGPSGGGVGAAAGDVVAHESLSGPDGAAKVKTQGGYEGLAGRADMAGVVSVIVRLAGSFSADAELPGAAARSQRLAIRERQSELDSLAGSSSGSFSGIKHFKYIPFSALTVDRQGLDQLLAAPLVASIVEDLAMRAALSDSVPLIGAASGAASAGTGAGWAVAILDTGVDSSHPMLDEGVVVSEACFSDTNPLLGRSSLCDDAAEEMIGEGAAMPYAGRCPTGQCDHGTHVAGIAAGREHETDGADGVAQRFSGVAPGAAIIAVQVFHRQDFGLFCDDDGDPCVRTLTSDYIRGLEHVYSLRDSLPAAQKIAAVNLSLGGGLFSTQTLCEWDARATGVWGAIQNLRGAGIAVVAAAGNDSAREQLSSPACLSNVVSVGSVYNAGLGLEQYGVQADDVASDSNFSRFLSLLAPGAGIESAVPGGAMTGMSGTSMAAPHVAGAWARLKEARPAATIDQILTALSTTGRLVEDRRTDPAGLGAAAPKRRIDVRQAYEALRAVVPPPAATLTSPSGPLTTTPATFRWRAVPGSTWYYLWVNNAGGTAVNKTWYTASQAGCSSGTECAVTPATILSTGVEHKWWVQSYSNGLNGPWSAPLTFRPTPPTPSGTTLVAPSGAISTATPAFTWNKVGSASWYYLNVDTASGQSVLREWVRATDACGTGGTCGVTRRLGSGSYTWRVQTYGSGLYGPWSASLGFTLSIPTPPPAASLIAPSGSTSSPAPTFTWSKVETSTWYYLWVTNGSGTVVVREWVRATDVCAATTCSASRALAPGSYTWWIQTYSAVGYGPWSSSLGFSIASTGAPPPAATLVSPRGTTNTSTPTFVWNRVGSATSYQLWVNRGTVNIIQEWISSEDACGSDTTCSVTRSVGPGSHTWWIRTRNASGTGPWSQSLSFANSLPGLSFVLTWGAGPRDLDAHLVTPPAPDTAAHIYYSNPGSAAGAPFATLDVDDTDGYGPETISIHRLFSGTYRYYVHAYSSDALVGNRAIVHVRDSAGNLLRTVTVPTSDLWTYWHVADVDGATGTVTVVNRLLDAPPGDMFGVVHYERTSKPSPEEGRPPLGPGPPGVGPSR
jgi:hypothetical protein